MKGNTMNSKKVFSLYSLFVLALVLTAAVWVQVAAAQDTAQDAAQAVTYTFTGQTLTGPDQLPAGYHSFTLQNDADQKANLHIVKLNGDTTADDFLAAAENMEQSFAGQGDVVATMNQALAEGGFWGGPAAEAKESESIGADLPAGRYLLLAGIESEDGPASYVTKDLTVVSGEATTAPQADVTAQMIEFAFALPADIKTGEQTWKVVNDGTQAHHLVLMRLKDGATMDQVMAAMQNDNAEPPVDEVGETDILSPGSSNYVTFDLTPGTYVALCFLPDTSAGGDGQPHVAHGMMQSFTVASN